MILKRKEKENKVKAIYDSSNILASTYDLNNGDLTLIFKSGSQYKYPNVSKSDYMRFEIAESQGKVFNTHIKKYTFEKMDNFDVGEISVEIETLANKEKEALLEAKKMDIMTKISHLQNISENDNNNIFVENLVKLKEYIENFLSEINADNSLV